MEILFIKEDAEQSHTSIQFTLTNKKINVSYYKIDYNSNSSNQYGNESHINDELAQKKFYSFFTFANSFTESDLPNE